MVGIKYYLVLESNSKRLNHQMQAPRRSVRETNLCQGDRSLATRRLLALENQTDSDAFLVVSLDTLCSTSFRWLSLLLFGGELDC